MNPFYVTIPKNVPRQLVDLFRENDSSVRAIEKLRNVNRYYVYQLLRKGVEPTDKTKKGRAARVALFLPERKVRSSYDVPDYVKKWRSLSKEERRTVIRQYITWKDEHEQKSNGSGTNDVEGVHHTSKELVKG